MMLLMSCSDTSVPMEISAASLTSASISSGRMSERSEPATFVRSPEGQKPELASTNHQQASASGWSSLLKHLSFDDTLNYQFCGRFCSKPSCLWWLSPARESASRTTPCSAWCSCWAPCPGHQGALKRKGNKNYTQIQRNWIFKLKKDIVFFAKIVIKDSASLRFAGFFCRYDRHTLKAKALFPPGFKSYSITNALCKMPKSAVLPHAGKQKQRILSLQAEICLLICNYSRGVRSEQAVTGETR